MTQYTLWSRSDFRNVIRREVMDTSSRWFSDAEINFYLDEWLQDLQQEFEFVWAISTMTVGTVTSVDGTTPPILKIGTYTFSPGMLRNEAVYYNGFRLAGRNLQDLEVGDPIWRGDTGAGAPPNSPQNYDIPRASVMYADSQSILIWPCPPPPSGTSSNIFTFEYPAVLTFATDTSTSGLPVWTQWCARPFVCMKIYQRPGPLNDTKKAMRYKAQYERAKLRVRRMWDSFLPERFRRLQPGQHYEWEILTPPPAWDVGTNTASDSGAQNIIYSQTTTPAFVQGFISNTGSPASFTSNNTAGNCILVAARSEGGNGTPNISDSNGNTYTQLCNITSFPAFVGFLQCWVAFNCASGPNTITVSGTGSSLLLSALEYSGAGSVDASASTHTNVSSITTTATNDTVVFIASGVPLSPVAPVQTGTFTSRESAFGTYGGTVRGLSVWDLVSGLPGVVTNGTPLNSLSGELDLIVALKGVAS